MNGASGATPGTILRSSRSIRVNFPHNDIATIHRGGPSGDTFVFSQYLMFSTEKWDSRIGFVSPESWQKRLGFGTTVAWPGIPGASDAVGHAETAAALRSFLLWAIAPDETNAQYLADTHFIPLPAHVWVLSHDQIEEIR
jgi:ABC-type phosphate transport system substrate-binding protein